MVLLDLVLFLTTFLQSVGFVILDDFGNLLIVVSFS